MSGLSWILRKKSMRMWCQILRGPHSLISHRGPIWFSVFWCSFWLNKKMQKARNENKEKFKNFLINFIPNWRVFRDWLVTQCIIKYICIIIKLYHGYNFWTWKALSSNRIYPLRKASANELETFRNSSTVEWNLIRLLCSVIKLSKLNNFPSTRFLDVLEIIKNLIFCQFWDQTIRMTILEFFG